MLSEELILHFVSKIFKGYHIKAKSLLRITRNADIDAGCHVIYGLDGYKVHSKLCQIMKKKDGNVEYYTQIGTGNYNEKTARLYTDLSLMTADPKIGTEAARVFQALAMGETVEDMDHLLVAPKCLQNKVLAMIDEEIEHAKVGEQAYIGLKMNSLTDKRIMNKLVEASCAGVHIDMVVRGICCLIPGVKGQTENIHIISIVGRFLEHSRIYIFGTQERAKIYISSADFMTRNTLRRVEVAAPIEDPDIRMQIQEMFVTMLSDNRKARTMNNKGNYKIEPSDNAPLNSQEEFMAHRKVVLCLLGATLAASLFSGCSGKKSDPVTVTVWTYYNGDQLDTFKDLTEKFNDTVGKKDGITVETKSLGTAEDLEQNVLAAADGEVGASEVPNIFSAYSDTAYTMDQKDMLVDLSGGEIYGAFIS